MFRARSNDCYRKQSALRSELGSPPILSALKDGVKEKPFRALTEISLSRVMRTTPFIQLFLFTACLPQKQVLNLVLSCYYTWARNLEHRRKHKPQEFANQCPLKNRRVSSQHLKFTGYHQGLHFHHDFILHTAVFWLHFLKQQFSNTIKTLATLRFVYQL